MVVVMQERATEEQVDAVIARLTAAAAASTCAGVSAEHGPAMTITSSPPTLTSPTETTVSSGLKVRLASL